MLDTASAALAQGDIATAFGICEQLGILENPENVKLINAAFRNLQNTTGGDATENMRRYNEARTFLLEKGWPGIQ